MKNNRLRIKIITSDKANEKVQKLLYQSIAKQIFESADFQKMLEDNTNNLREAL